MQLFAEMCQVIESESGRIAKKQLFKHYLMEFPEKSRIKVLQIFLGEINPHIGRKSINIKQSALFTREYTIDEIYNTIRFQKYMAIQKADNHHFYCNICWNSRIHLHGFFAQRAFSGICAKLH